MNERTDNRRRRAHPEGGPGAGASSGDEARNAGVGAEELVRQGDAMAAAGDWIAAVERWRAAAGIGAEAEARARLRGVLERVGRGQVAEDGVPRRALQPLAICLEAAALGVLAFVAAGRGPSGIDPVLLVVGWLGMAVAAGGALVFAARSGRLDGAPAAPVTPATASLDELGARAAEVAVLAARIGKAPPPSIRRGPTEPAALPAGRARSDTTDPGPERTP